MTEQPRRSNRIHIYLCPPKMMVQKVSIVLTRPVGCLNKLFSEEKIFIYKGILLQNEKPFSEYRIVEGSQLIMFSKKKGSTSESNQMNAWMHITRDQDDILNKTSYHPNFIYQTHGKDPTESFLDTDNDMYNNNIVMNEDNNHHEFAKLRDIRYLQMENSSKLYKKLCKAYSSNVNGGKEKFNVNIDFNPLDNPAENPLPCLWKIQPSSPPPVLSNQKKVKDNDYEIITIEKGIFPKEKQIAKTES